MYKSFYNLNRKPFQISSDPAFMWFGEKHKEALATLKYGILDNKGFLLLTGDVGTGKTSLINALIQSLSDDIICASVPDPGLEKLDFFNYIAAAFGMNQEFSTKGTFLAHFRKFLIKANENNKKVLLIIDEAQLLTQEMLEEIRLLSNIEKTGAKLINIFFIGQNEFNDILNREQNRAVRQRLTLNYNIDPLTPDETGEYIKHRLSVAGAVYSIFDEPATQEVFIHSGGFPRRINVICDHCLLSGYVKEQKVINDAIVKECAKELKIPAHIKNRDINASYYERPVPGVKPYPYQSKAGKIEIRRKKRGFQFYLSAIICLLFLFFAWFYLFPNTYSDSVTLINKNVTEFKHTLLKIIPESYLSFLKQNPGHEREIKENMIEMNKQGKQIIKKIEGLKDKKKTDELQAVDEPNTIGKIKPVQEEILKEDEVRHIIQPLNEVKLKKINKEKQRPVPSLENTNNEMSDGGMDVENNKVILPMPREKVIIRFKYNTNDFTEEGFKKLVEFADILITHPEAKLLVSGFTDSEGYQKYNRKLSKFRANIVGSFLLGRGVKANQIQIKGLGSLNPIESNETARGRMMNRRVEIEILEK